MTKKNIRAAAYVRVSTSGQTVENQLQDIRRAAEQRGWELVTVYKDEGISGAKGRDKRPEFDAMLKAAVRGEFDVLMAWSVDRLGRSVADLVGSLGDLHAASVDLYLHQQGIDTATPSGKAMFQMLGVFAEFERAMIRERVNAGLARARAAEKKLGRPTIGDAKAARIKELAAGGMGQQSIARELRTGVGTVRRVLGVA